MVFPRTVARWIDKPEWVVPDIRVAVQVGLDCGVWDNCVGLRESGEVGVVHACVVVHETGVGARRMVDTAV